MESAPVLDFDALLQPIPGDNPAGVHLRSEHRAEYDAIRAGGRQARQNEERATPEEGGAANAGITEWRTVKPAALSALRDKTKDLEICSYLIEALLRLDGAAGLRDGFRLARELIERYWDRLYPEPEDGDLHTRVAILAGLNGDSDTPGTLPPAIRRLVLATPQGTSPMYFTDYHDAVGKMRKNPEGGDFLEPLRNAVRATDTNALRALDGDLKAASREVAALSDLLDQKCGSAAPGFGYIRREIEICQDTLAEMAGDRLREEQPIENGGGGDDENGGGGGGGGGGGKGGPVRDRESALKSLLEVADFFERTEPHSVIPFSLRQVVRWGRLSLPELLKELIPDRQSRQALYERVGIPESDNS